MKNLSLNKANYAKKDEFYTQYDDIEKEMICYGDFFVDKTVFCNCDDPYESNFFKYFVLNFNRLGIRKLVATCYSKSCVANTVLQIGVPYKAVVSSPLAGPGFEFNDQGSMAALFKQPGNSLVHLDGDGDFRSAECVGLLREADVVVTNPPFSLFREYVAQLMRYGKKFVIIGNVNAITYKEIIPLILNGHLWLGASIHSGDRKFFVPNGYPLDAAGCGIDEHGHRFIRVKGVRWFTNIDYECRHTGITLNERYDENRYPKYDNYNAVEVGKVVRIPCYYKGLMGVPITFLDKYDPDQFEIISLANGNARTTMTREALDEVGYVATRGDKGGVCLLRGRRKYARLIIRHKQFVDYE